MRLDAHEQARQLIACAGAEDLAEPQQAWVKKHLEGCPSCREYAEAAEQLVRFMRAIPIAADRSLVRTTQMRVRQRALELQRQQERLWVICVCCVAVTLATGFTTAVLWRGFAWMGQQVRLAGPVWQIGLVALGLMPAIVAGILLLARGTYLADHKGSFQG